MSLIIETDEIILWEGNPYPGPVLGIEMVAVTIFSIIIMICSVALAFILPRKTGLFWPVFLSGGSISLFFLIAYPALDMFQRRRTSYILTNKRAIHLRAGGKIIQEIRKDEWNALNLIDSCPPSVEYARLSTSFSNMRSAGRIPAQSKTLGFWRINEAPKVYELMKEVLLESDLA